MATRDAREAPNAFRSGKLVRGLLGSSRDGHRSQHETAFLPSKLRGDALEERNLDIASEKVILGIFNVQASVSRESTGRGRNAFESEALARRARDGRRSG